MTARILVTGGTGTLGSRVVDRLLRQGETLRIAARRPVARHDGVEHATVDLLSGEGLAAALQGIETIIHCAGAAKGDDVVAANLVAAARSAGVRHLVFPSVVGADRVPILGRIDRAMFGYFGAKRAAEEIIARSGLGWSIVRATQFHESLFKVAAAMAKLPVLPLPAGVRFQPVSADEVADRLVELARGEPQGRVPDLGGPQVVRFDELIDGYLAARRMHGRLKLRLPLPGAAAAAFRRGANLALDRAVGHLGWTDFVAGEVARSKA